MNIQKLVRKVESLLNADERNRKEKRKHLKQVLKKLKKQEKNLIHQLESEADQDTRDMLEKEITLAHAQRKKGLTVLKELKKTKKST